MPITITNPVGDDRSVCIKQPVHEAKVTVPGTVARLDWRVSVRGALFELSAVNSATAVFTAPARVVRMDVAGSVGPDDRTIESKNRLTGVKDTTALLLLVGLTSENFGRSYQSLDF